MSTGGARHLPANMRNSSRGSGRAIPIPLEPLKEGHRMDPQERLFLEAAERGDKHTMIRCLQGPNPVNVNCTNILGRSAIQIAVDNENVEIVELLLRQDGVKIGDALLYAIREGVYRIVEMLIDHPSITREMLGSEWARFKATGEESSDYPPDISPVILASHCNQFEILQLLLSRGAKIEKPHDCTCSCTKCKKENNADSLRHSLLRIHTYRALASPAWISLTSSDPVLTAFKLSWELDHLAMRENEFKDLYAELEEQCKKYACDLLEQCRSSEEVIAVLNKDTDSDSDSESECDETGSPKLTLSRFKLALKYEQKQFVAHPHCQQLLASIWYEGLPGWRKRSVPAKILIIISLICVMPFMAAIYLFFPHSKIGQLIRTPFMKFMYHSASFGVFLLLLMLASTNVSAGGGDHKWRQQQRGPPPTPLEWLIVFYVLGFIWGECKQLWEEGLKAYVRQWWNWLDFMMLSLYLCTLSLRIVAYAQSLDEENYGPSNIPRTMWPEAEPTLISEGVFAIANVFSFARIIYLFQANPQLGPLQISLGCMLIDIGKFFFIFFLVITSFACGLNQLYYYYTNADNAMQVAPPPLTGNNDTGEIIPQQQVQTNEEYENAFDPILNSYMTLCWSLFGLTQLSTVREGHMQPFTKRTGELLLMVYHTMAVIVLINMLIAMMSNSFQEIEDHADREWKFARSKLWMGYFDDGCTLPPPFNLIISPKSIYYVLRWLKRTAQNLCFKPPSRQPPRRKSAEGTMKTRKSPPSLRRKKAVIADVDNNARVKLLPVENNNKKQNPNISVIGYTNNHVQGGIALDNFTPLPNSQALQAIGQEMPNVNGDSCNHAPHNEQPKYQDVMRRLVSRFIHQWKKQMRQDGVNEDDLLEIKQDISSLRYELREDRKREAARTAGHIDNLKMEILRSIGGDMSSLKAGSHPGNHPAVGHLDDYQGGMSTFMEMDTLRRDIVSSLRVEIRELAREIATNSGQNPRGSPVNPPGLVPPLSSELYQTHLYTQL